MKLFRLLVVVLAVASSSPLTVAHESGTGLTDGPTMASCRTTFKAEIEDCILSFPGDTPAQDAARQICLDGARDAYADCREQAMNG